MIFKSAAFVVLLSTSFLYGKVIKGIDLKPNATYENIVLKGANLSGLNLQGIVFFSCDLRGVKFGGTNLKNAIIKRSNLYKANFNGTILEKASVDFSNFKKAVFRNVNMHDLSAKGTDFTYAKISKSDARSANFEKAKFIKTKINGLDARKAIFKKSIFLDMEIKNSKFWAADFRYIALKNVLFNKCGLEEAKFNINSIIKNISFKDTRWTDNELCEEKGLLYCLKEGISIFR